MSEQIDKASDTAVGITPTPVQQVIELSDLKKQLDALVRYRDNYVSDLNTRIATLQFRIDEAVKLGIKDSVTAVEVKVP